MSYEVRIGLLALVSIAISLWGIKFIQGQNIFSSSDTYYAYFEDVGGIQIGTPVQISGVSVGSVASIDLGLEDKRVKLTLTLERDVPLPKNSRAVLATVSFLGDKAIILQYDQPCNGSNCAESGDVLDAHVQGMVESILGEGGAEGYINTFKDGLQDVIDTLNYELLGQKSDSPVAHTARDLQATMSNMKDATARVNLLLQRSSPELEAALSHVSELTGALEAQKENIANILANADTLSQQIVDAKLDEAMVQVKATITKLNETLGTADTAMDGVSTMINKIQQGEGTLGKLMTDEELYSNLNALSFSLDSLLSDLQDKPYRYVPLKSRRKVQRYDRQDDNAQDN